MNLAISFQQHEFVIGIDEVGTGSWAGPIVVGAVVAPVGWDHPAVRDSKRYSKTKSSSAHDKRAKVLKEAIKPEVIFSTVCHISAEQLDSWGSTKSWTIAVKRVLVRCMNLYPDSTIIIDGEAKGDIAGNVFFEPKADDCYPAVRAASVVAKVSRDALMKKAARIYPGYGFESNVGYGTQEHQEGIDRQGLCPLHRRTFLGKREKVKWRTKATPRSQPVMHASIASRMQHKLGQRGSGSA